MEVKMGHPIHEDVDHINPLSKGGGNTAGNLRVTSKATNRSFKRDKGGHLVSQTSKREGG